MEVGIDNSIICNNCFYFDLCCHIIPNSMNCFLKCGECFKASIACFYIFWDVFDRWRAELKKKIKNDEKCCN